MGYFANGLVFTSAPDYEAMTAINPGRFARGYKHKQLPIWLLDFWKPRGKLLLRSAPFADPAIDAFRIDLAGVDAATRNFLTTLRELKDTAEQDTPDPEFAYIHFSLGIALAGRCSSFCFAADDEETDLGCRTIPGSLVSFGCRFNWLSMRYESGHTSVTPLNLFLPEHLHELHANTAKLKKVQGIQIMPPSDVEDGQTFYENPVGQWPGEAGDPAEVLGLGTWDPLLNLENDYEVVYEHLTI